VPYSLRQSIVCVQIIFNDGRLSTGAGREAGP
jgi:hypothetical protein